jgi:uncharacterized DUF497 family protein
MTYHCFVVFEWDDSKAESNNKKHGVSFAEAATAFSDPQALEVFDRKNSLQEDRWILVGISAKDQVLVVVFVEREEQVVRIISARQAVRVEIETYYSKVKS